MNQIHAHSHEFSCSMGKGARVRNRSVPLQVKRPTEIGLGQPMTAADDQNPKARHRAPSALTVIMPMADPPSRRVPEGFCRMAPLTVIDSTPVFEHARANLGADTRCVFIVREEDYRRYNLAYLFGIFVRKFEIVRVDEAPKGPACAALAAAQHIPDDQPLVVARPDQVLDWQSESWWDFLGREDPDGCIVTVSTNNPQWRHEYVAADADGRVLDVAAKKRISPLATTGVYYWKRGRDFTQSARQLVAKDLSSNNMFHLCSVFSQDLAAHRDVRSYRVANMWDLSSPAGVAEYRSLLDETPQMAATGS